MFNFHQAMAIHEYRHHRLIEGLHPKRRRRQAVSFFERLATLAWELVSIGEPKRHNKVRPAH